MSCLGSHESLRHVPPAQKTASHLSSKSAFPSLGLLAFFRCDLRLFVTYSFLHLIRRFTEIKVSYPSFRPQKRDIEQKDVRIHIRRFLLRACNGHIDGFYSVSSWSTSLRDSYGSH